jgi:PhnB protein
MEPEDGMDDSAQGVVPMLSYAEGSAAMDWLSSAFGFEERERWLDESGVLAHGEMSTGHGLIMLATPTPDYEGPRLHRSHCRPAAAWAAAPWVIDGVLVYVDDIVAHFERAETAGASMLSGVEDGPAGSRLYRAEDVEGHRWMFMQSSTSTG